MLKNVLKKKYHLLHIKNKSKSLKNIYSKIRNASYILNHIFNF